MLVLLPFKMHILLSFNKSKHMKILSLFQSIHLDFYNGLHLYKKTHHTNNSVKSRITHDSKKIPVNINKLKHLSRSLRCYAITEF